MPKKVTKGIKDLFDNPEKIESFDESSMIEGTINGKRVKIMHHKLKNKSLYSYKVNDYRFSLPMEEKQLKKNLQTMKLGN